MNRLRFVLLFVSLVVLVGVSAGALNVPNTFVSGDVISAAEVNENFTAVETAVTALEAAQPVVAYRYVFGNVLLDNTAVEAEDVIVVSIDAPADGVVIVEAVAQARWNGTDQANFIGFRLDTDPGGVLGGSGDHEYLVGTNYPGGPLSTWDPIAVQRAFAVTAGTHEFRLEALAQTASGNKYFWNPTIRATWYPTGVIDLQSAATIGTSGNE